MKNSTGAQFHHHEHIKGAEAGRHDDEEVAGHDRFGVMVNEREPTLVWTGRAHRAPLRSYFSTIRGETRIPSFSFNSLAMRLSPQVGFSAPISRISCRSCLGRRGLPASFDFQRQESRNPLRCQRISVSGLTFTSASRHWSIRLRVAIIHRVESSARCGLTFRSWKSANCFRRNRFSAANAARGRTCGPQKLRTE